MPALAPELCNFPLLASAPRSLRYNPEIPFPQQQKQAREAFLKLLGPTPPAVPLDIQIDSETDHPTYHEIRYFFTSEPNAQCVVHLLIPKSAKTPPPVVICIQGHSPGMYISLGISKTDAEKALVNGDRDYALQVVNQGYAALTLEQRAFGERVDKRPPEPRGISKMYGCHHAAMAALMIGRTLIGQRVLDVSRAIDSLAHFPQVDSKRIGCMGNSGGGTCTYYAAAFDPRINIAMPACSVCTFYDSIGTIDHCMCNYIPGILNYFEMADVSILIAPRPLLVVAGEQDTIFPIAGVKKAMHDIEQIYQAAAKEAKNPALAKNCRLVTGPEGHRFYAKPSWPVFKELSGW